MKIVISPAKNLDFQSSRPTATHSECLFLQEAEKLIKKLKKLSPNQVSELMHISPALGELNYQRYQDWQLPFSENASKQAVFAFNGEVYNGLSADTLNANQINFMQKHLRILSGLYGVLKPLDNILPYRLEMGTKFAYSSSITNLYKFWGEQLTNYLNAEMEEANETAIINLASTEYFKALNVKKLNADIYTPVFKDNSKGQYKVVMMYAKKARGMMARFIIENNINIPEHIKAFDSEGYAFNPKLSENNQWVFTRG